MKKLLLTICCVLFASTMVLADPLPGQTLKFQQLPMDGRLIDGVTYWGHDELSTAYNTSPFSPNGNFYQGHFMADDFADPYAKPVVHVKWWGSYMNQLGTNQSGGIRKFLISFESDVPAGTPHPVDGTTVDYSRPGIPLLNQTVTLGLLAPASSTFTETLVSGGGDPLFEALYMYNAELDCPFNQEPDTVYWLKIVALWDVDPDDPYLPEWGWHNRDYTIMDPFASPAVVPGEYIDGTLPDGQDIWHFQDDAVEGSVTVFDSGFPCLVNVDQLTFGPTYYVDGVDGPGPSAGDTWEGISSHSKDLAFALYAAPVPEPSTFMLLGLGAACLMSIRRRRTR